MTARGVDFPDKISVRSGLRHVERFRGTCVGHAVFQENLRLVDMPKGDIGERGCSQCIPVKRNYVSRHRRGAVRILVRLDAGREILSAFASMISAVW